MLLDSSEPHPHPHTHQKQPCVMVYLAPHSWPLQVDVTTVSETHHPALVFQTGLEGPRISGCLTHPATSATPFCLTGIHMPETERQGKGHRAARVTGSSEKRVWAGSAVLEARGNITVQLQKTRYALGERQQKGLFARLFKISLRLLSTLVLSK